MKGKTEQNRLTKRIMDHVYYTMGAYSETIPEECTPQDVRHILKRLADYEDTGLSPEGIKHHLSSEQAAREEIENERILSSRIVEKTSKEITRLESQLNQAMNVIKGALALASKGRNRANNAGRILREGLTSLSQETAQAKEPYPTADAYEAACKALWKHRNTISEAVAIWESMDDFDDSVTVMEKVIEALKGGISLSQEGE